MSAKNTVALNTETFASGANSVYIDQIYDQWKKEPASVHASWSSYFTNLDNGLLQPYQGPPNLVGTVGMTEATSYVPQPTGGFTVKDLEDSNKILMLARSFSRKGHELADLDPLQLNKILGYWSRNFEHVSKELDYKYYGFTEADLTKEFNVFGHDVSGFLKLRSKWKLGELIECYKNAYCGKIGVEMMHIMNKEECNWIREQIELTASKKLPDDKRLQFFACLQEGQALKDFFEKKFATVKRFSVAGIDAIIPALQFAIKKAVDCGMEKTMIGMSHRGRVDALALVVRKPMEIILSEFQAVAPTISPHSWGTAGDVKYHLGTTKKMTVNGKEISITMLPNPSHLEQVDPMLAGRVRAEQDYMDDKDRTKVLGILVHGDAAFAGQGVVYETIQMADLKNFCTGGTIHFIVNNQIGYTTAPRDSRTSVYCTELGKCVSAPILHVNGEDPDAIVRASEFAAEYRQKYHKDVIIDLIAYRLYGHNELDQPKFTNPVMYNVIEKMKTFYSKQRDILIQSNLKTASSIDNMYKAIWEKYEKALEASKKIKFDWGEWVALGSTVMKKPEEVGGFGKTGLPKKYLAELGIQISTLPEGWIFHPQIVKIFQGRLQSLKEGKGLDWATAEHLAWATLLKEGYNVRISGQDVQRGTFSHRHAYLHHQIIDKHYVPLKEIANISKTTFVAANSHLSECGVLGFEYAYSMALPNTLTMWEGQFGDFANGAQVMIDQLVTSGEVKWGTQIGLTMLLPHGFDGQGAEHSSARLERYLQLSDDDPLNVPLASKASKRVNIQVLNCSTSSNVFHAFRRQMKRDYRKPLILMTPKRLLRLREAGSNIDEYDEHTEFRPTIDDDSKNLVQPSLIKKVIFCSGQVYYDFVKARDDAKINV